MGFTLAEKIIAAHLVEGEMVAGAEIGIRIDHTLTQDATGTMAWLELRPWESNRVDRARRKLCGITTMLQPTSGMPTITATCRRRQPGMGPTSRARQRHLPPGAVGALQRPREDASSAR